MSSSHRHDFPIRIESVDIDFMGHVNNAVYLKWVQEAVVDHWQCHAPPEAVAAYLWIALKHEITYRRPALLGDKLTASLSLEKVQRESAFYETIVRRGPDVVAEIKSRWCCVDAVARQPVRVSDTIIRCFFPEHPETIRALQS